MNKSKSTAICVLGMHRSGTSAITRVLNLFGAYLGETNKLMPPQDGVNPEGFWEHLEIVDLNDRILRKLSRTWDNPIPLPDKWWQHSEMLQYKKEIKQIIKKNFNKIHLWAWKDPRACLTLPLWQEVLSQLDIDVKYIISLRNPIDVASSLKRRDAFSTEHSVALWFLYTLLAIKYTKKNNRIFIHYDRLLENWTELINPLADWLNVPRADNKEESINAISGFIKPSLRHSYTSYNELVSQNKIPIPVINLYELCIKVIQKPEIAFSTEFTQKIDSLYSTYTTYSSLMGNTKTYNLNTTTEIIQVFWLDQNSQTYCPELSISKSVSREVNEVYEFIIPAEIKSPIRIDPASSPNFIEIKSIRIIQKLNEEIIGEENQDNNYKNVICGEGVIKVPSKDSLKLIATNDDPQIILHFNNPTSEEQSDLLVMIEVLISRDTNKLIEAWKHNNDIYKQEIEDKDKELYLRQNLINEIQNELMLNEKLKDSLKSELETNTNLINDLQNELKYKQDTITANINLINELRNQLAYKQDLLSIQQKELIIKNKELTTLEQDVNDLKQVVNKVLKQQKNKMEYIERLQVMLEEKDREYTLISNSPIWRLRKTVIDIFNKNKK